MSDDFGLLNLVGSPFLEKIAREERLGEELPRRPGNLKAGKAKKKPGNSKPDDSQDDENSETSRLIDLRI